MATLLIENVGAAGIVSDLDPKKLPAGTWDRGENVRFDGFTATKAGGSRVVYGSLSTSAYSLFAYSTFDGTPLFVYAGLNSVYTVNGATHNNITRATLSGTVTAYAADATELWTGGVLNGLLFLNSNIHVPQIQLTATAACRLSDLPNWPTTVTTRAACMRSFKNFLVALDVTKGALRYRQMVKWSSSADPLSPPATWDETLTTNDAGETTLAETDGDVVDCLPLRDVNIIYKTDSVWGMQYVGGAFIFRFYKIFTDVGIVAKRCVAAFESYHCFIGNDLDIYVHDGNSVRSIAQDKWRNWLRANIDSSNVGRAFMATNPTTTEIWICVPDGTHDYTTQVLMWNWRHDTWGVRTISNVSSGVTGVITSTDYVPTWATIASTWDTTQETWAELASIPTDKRLVLVSPTRTTGLIETEYSSTEFGDPLPFSLERRGLWAVPGGKGVVDLQSVKFIRRVRFRVGGSSAADLTYSVAVQSDMGSTLTYVATTKSLNGTAEVVVLKRGRFISVKIESAEDVTVVLHAIEVEYDPSGQYL